MKENQFRINGTQFYTETRRCSNENCKCHHGQEHGPYWWSLDSKGYRHYHGKDLPEEIRMKAMIAEAEVSTARKLQAKLEEEIRSLQRQAKDLEIVIHGEPTAREMQTLYDWENVYPSLVVTPKAEAFQF